MGAILAFPSRDGDDAAEAIRSLRSRACHRVTWGWISGDVDAEVIIAVYMTARRNGYSWHVLAIDGARLATFEREE